MARRRAYRDLVLVLIQPEGLSVVEQAHSPLKATCGWAGDMVQIWASAGVLYQFQMRLAAHRRNAEIRSRGSSFGSFSRHKTAPIPRCRRPLLGRSARRGGPNKITSTRRVMQQCVGRKRAGGRAQGGGKAGLAAAERRTQRPRRKACALPSTGAFCSGVTLSSSRATLHRRWGACGDTVQGRRGAGRSLLRPRGAALRGNGG